MAMEISISEDGWGDIYNSLSEATDSNYLAKAVSAAEMKIKIAEMDEPNLDFLEKERKLRERELIAYARETLPDLAYELVKKNNTVDNDGFNFWIDSDGEFKVNSNAYYNQEITDMIRLIDMDVTCNDPVTVNIHHNARENFNPIDFNGPAGAVLLSDGETLLAFNRSTGKLLLMPGASDKAKAEFASSGYSRTILEAAMEDTFEKRDPGHQYSNTNTPSFD